MSIQIIHPASDRKLKFLVFGPSGQGKTRLLGSGQLDPRTSPMLLLDYEAGLDTLVGLDIDVVRIRDIKDYNDVLVFLSKSDHQYKSVGLDSISERHMSTLLGLLEADKDRRNPLLLEQGDYGQAQTSTRQFMRQFRNLNMHVMMTSLSKEVTDVREGMVKTLALSGALADEVPGMFDVVGYLAIATNSQTENGDPQRVLILKNYPKIRTKARSAWASTIPDVIVDPTITSILDTLGYPMPG